ncbi:MAG: hypothetical protein PHN37_00805 [Candidatus Pacebacteria bacterium]|nr:hypothetical protein [Candidatus Paceibacterota bacterium]
MNRIKIIIILIIILIVILSFLFLFLQKETPENEQIIAEKDIISLQAEELKELMKDFKPLTEEDIKKQSEELKKLMQNF